MINTRFSIFKSLMRKLKGLTKYGKTDPSGFKTILYGIILNDMKEWSEYIPDGNSEKLVKILNEYILNHKDFQIERFIDNPELYKNVNTPQDNTTWRRIWDNKDYKVGDLNDHDKKYGSPTFRINGTSLIFYPKANATYDVDASATLNVQLHDKTLFENDRDEQNNDNLVHLQ